MPEARAAIAAPRPPRAVARASPQARRLWLLAASAVACIAAFMTLGAQGGWSFILPFRGGKLLAMLAVAYAVAVSSVLFQTITHNRILTPAIMGFDALYLLIQALVVYAFGQAAVATDHPVAAFLLEVGVMTAFACLLFRWLFADAVRSLHLMMVGIIFGLLFRSLSSFVIRLIDPNEFLVLQDRMFANFNSVRLELLPVALAVMGAVSLLLWRMRSRYDVLALGRDIAVNLGVDYRRTLLTTLAAIAALVSVSTALVGPVTFFGLLVSNLAYQLMGSDRHRHTLPAAMLLAVVFLVGGQTLLERVLRLNTTVSVVIEFLGGIVFLALILRRGAGDRYPERQQALRRQRGGRRRDAGAAGRWRHRHHRPERRRQVHAAVHDQPPAAVVRGPCPGGRPGRGPRRQPRTGARAWPSCGRTITCRCA